MPPDPVSEDPQIYLVQADAAIKEGRVAEAARLWVRCLRLSAGKPQHAELEEIARSSLTLLSSKLTLSPGASWLNSDGTQKTSSSQALSSGFQPVRVQLLQNSGTGKQIVQDMPVSFDMLSGSARLNSPVLTNDSGEAESPVLGLSAPNGTAMVKAFIRISDEGFSYVLENVSMNFTYVQPGNGVALAVFVKTGTNLTRDVSLEAQLAPSLRSLGLSLVPVSISGNLDTWYNGDSEVLSNLAERRALGKLVIVSFELEEPRQMEVNGRTFNIFTVSGSTHIRILSTSDGTLVYSWKSPSVRGQGGNAQTAVSDTLQRTSAATDEHLRQNSAPLLR